ncbi:hypothetical protein GH733_009898 [Mirounga leonina]|nr:hypothetical protein GH733_009898 [Mirounga leonina]
MSPSAFPSLQHLSGSNQGQRVIATYNQFSASFLGSILPSQSDYHSSKSPPLWTPTIVNPKAHIRNSQPRDTRIKREALSQDLEGKLKCKDNGNQWLTYEEKVGCRLLGSQSVAAVFQAQNCREAQDLPQHSSEHAQLGSSFRCRVFACVPMSRTGEASCTVLLSILPKEHRRAPMLVLRQQSKQVFEGGSVKLEYQISVGPPPKLFW